MALRSERLLRATAGRRVALALTAVLALAIVPEARGVPHVHGQAAPGGLLAVAGRQAAWLNLEAPRNQIVSHFAGGANALAVTAQPDGTHAVVAVGQAFAGGGARGADLVNLDLTGGDTAPLLTRSAGTESFDAPTWWPDRATLLFDRQDLGGQTVSPPGQEVPRYPSRIERVMADGTGRGVLLDEGRQPSSAPDGTRLVFARTRNQGAALLIWSQADGTVHTLVPEGRFADLAYPQFSPHSDQVAFVAPQSGTSGRVPSGASDLAHLLGLGGGVAYAHGIPWDPWVVNADGTNLHRAAETAADEPSVAWSPDATQLFVYSGTGSFLVELSGGTATSLPYVQGYGPLVWVSGQCCA